MKTWSISTTVRNPERIRDFLKILKLLEGHPFNKGNQEKYQTYCTEQVLTSRQKRALRQSPQLRFKQK